MVVKHELFENHTHSFIVKVWLERTPAENNSQAIWRGHITHVPSGERRYLKNLEDITAFVTPYLEGMGVESTLFQRIHRWINHKKLCRKAWKASKKVFHP